MRAKTTMLVMLLGIFVVAACSTTTTGHASHAQGHTAGDGSISVQVLMENGNPFPNGLITASVCDGENAKQPGHRARTNDEGIAVFENLSSNREYEITMWQGSNPFVPDLRYLYDVSLPVLKVPVGAGARANVTLTVPNGPWVTGTLTVKGAPFANAKFVVMSMKNGITELFATEGETDGLGRFYFYHIPDRQYAIYAEHVDEGQGAFHVVKKYDAPIIGVNTLATLVLAESHQFKVSVSLDNAPLGNRIVSVETRKDGKLSGMESLEILKGGSGVMTWFGNRVLDPETQTKVFVELPGGKMREVDVTKEMHQKKDVAIDLSSAEFGKLTIQRPTNIATISNMYVHWQYVLEAGEKWQGNSIFETYPRKLPDGDKPMMLAPGNYRVQLFEDTYPNGRISPIYTVEITQGETAVLSPIFTTAAWVEVDVEHATRGDEIIVEQTDGATMKAHVISSDLMQKGWDPYFDTLRQRGCSFYAPTRRFPVHPESVKCLKHRAYSWAADPDDWEKNSTLDGGTRELRGIRAGELRAVRFEGVQP
ncbi:MAG: hypothetical protein HUU29_10370 [Planctomycetaceae bacterium]|nr:hypothetical protein [Planctomycetaceae bacterium]